MCVVVVCVLGAEGGGGGEAGQRGPPHLACLCWRPPCQVSLLRLMQDSPYTIHLFDALEDDYSVYIVTELCSGGDLEDLIAVSCPPPPGINQPQLLGGTCSRG